MNQIELIVCDEYAQERVDAFVASQIKEITRSYAAQLIEKKRITVNGNTISKSLKLKLGDCVIVSLPEPELSQALAENIALDIVYEDDCLLVVNKPKGMVVHPATGNYTKTLVNALLYHCKGRLSAINGEIRPGIVHRIDKDTSGLLVVAKDNDAHLALSEQLAKHSMTREYQAVVYGRFKNDIGFIEKPIGRSVNDRKKMAISDKNSKPAYTSYKVIEGYNGFTLLSLRLKTGRTHQIRVHLASIGHPVVGDIVYGPKKAVESLNGQCLHAKTLGFIHPKTNEYLEFSSNLPLYFTEFIHKLQKDCNI